MIYNVIRNILIVTIVALLAFGVGIVFPNQEVEIEEETVSIQELPLAPELLLNSVYYEWWASAEGILVQKTEDSITLEKNGSQAVVIVKDEFTKFFIEDAETRQITPISFDEVVIGSELRGGVLMSKKDTLGLAGKENVAVGDTFIIIAEPSL